MSLCNDWSEDRSEIWMFYALRLAITWDLLSTYHYSKMLNNIMCNPAERKRWC